MKLSKQAEIIERFNNGVSIKSLSIINKLSFDETYAIVNKYFSVKGINITIPSISTATPIQIIHHFWDTKAQKELAEILGVSRDTIKIWAIKAGLPKKKKVFRNGINRLYESRSIILNTQTGIYYFSKPEAAHSINRKEEYVRWNLFKSKINKTYFIYCGKF